MAFDEHVKYLFLHRLFLLWQDQLNVARWGHIRIDASMSTVGAAPLLLGLVHLDVWNIEVVHIQAFHISVTLSILQQIQYEPGWFNRPATLPIGVARLCLRGATNTPTVSPEGNCLLVSNNILKVSLSLGQRQLAKRKGCLPCVLQWLYQFSNR